MRLFLYKNPPGSGFKDCLSDSQEFYGDHAEKRDVLDAAKLDLATLKDAVAIKSEYTVVQDDVLSNIFARALYNVSPVGKVAAFDRLSASQQAEVLRHINTLSVNGMRANRLFVGDKLQIIEESESQWLRITRVADNQTYKVSLDTQVSPAATTETTGQGEGACIEEDPDSGIVKITTRNKTQTKPQPRNDVFKPNITTNVDLSNANVIRRLSIDDVRYDVLQKPGSDTVYLVNVESGAVIAPEDGTFGVFALGPGVFLAVDGDEVGIYSSEAEAKKAVDATEKARRKKAAEEAQKRQEAREIEKNDLKQTLRELSNSANYTTVAWFAPRLSMFLAVSSVLKTDWASDQDVLDLFAEATDTINEVLGNYSENIPDQIVAGSFNREHWKILSEAKSNEAALAKAGVPFGYFPDIIREKLQPQFDKFDIFLERTSDLRLESQAFGGWTFDDFPVNLFDRQKRKDLEDLRTKLSDFLALDLENVPDFDGYMAYIKDPQAELGVHQRAQERSVASKLNARPKDPDLKRRYKRNVRKYLRDWVGFRPKDGKQTKVTVKGGAELRRKQYYFEVTDIDINFSQAFNEKTKGQISVTNIEVTALEKQKKKKPRKKLFKKRNK